MKQIFCNLIFIVKIWYYLKFLIELVKGKYIIFLVMDLAIKLNQLLISN